MPAAQGRRMPCRELGLGRGGSQIFDVEGARLQGATADDGRRVHRHTIATDLRMHELRIRALAGDEEEPFVLETPYAGILRATEACRACRDRMEYRLHVGWRAGNDLEDLCRGRLLLEGLADLHVGVRQRAVLFL